MNKLIQEIRFWFLKRARNNNIYWRIYKLIIGI